MTDNELINVLATRMEAGMAANSAWRYQGKPFLVQQAQQPTQQGMPYGPMATFEKLFDNRYGWPMAAALTYDPDADVFDDREDQLVETTFQIGALVIQNPEDLTIPTPSDVVNYMAQYLSHRQSLAAFGALKVGLIRVTEVRNPYFEDDRHRNEASPNFDIVLQHTRSISIDVGAVSKITGRVLPVLP